MTQHNEHDNFKAGFFDSWENTKTVLYIFFAVTLLLGVGDFFMPKEEAHFPWEASPLFYGIFGFLSCSILVLVSKFLLRPLVMREEDFYDDELS